jgi:hypothetical protein
LILQNKKQPVVDFFELIGMDNINYNFEQLENTLKDQEIKKPKNLLLNEKLPFFQNEIKVFSVINEMEIPSKKLHINYFYSLKVPFTAEFIILYKLNCDKYMRNDMSTCFTRLNHSMNNDMIVLFGIVEEKKHFMLNPKKNLVIRVIKKNKRYIEEYEKSVDLTNLRNDVYINKFLNQIKNEEKIFFASSRYEIKEGERGCWMHSSKEIEIEKNYQPEFLDEKIKKNIRECFDLEMKKMLKFLITVRDYEGLFWFKRKNKIKKIFEDNFKIFRNIKIDLTNFDVESGNSFYLYLKNKNQNVLKEKIFKSQNYRINLDEGVKENRLDHLDSKSDDKITRKNSL